LLKNSFFPEKLKQRKTLQNLHPRIKIANQKTLTNATIICQEFYV